MEDFPVNQLLVRRIIESWGLEVAIANNGREAVQMVQEQDFDLILMDIQMPEMDGMEATRCIRKLPHGDKAAIPIVALTANFFKDDREKYKAAGMNDLLPKPFSESTLFIAISNNLSSPAHSQRLHAREKVRTNHPGQLYDLSVVRGLCGGDEKFVKQMVELFLDTVQDSIRQMRAEVQQQNWLGAASMAHKIKGAAETIGIKWLSKELRTIIDDGRVSRNVEKIPELVERVAMEMEEPMNRLRKDFSL